MKREVYLHPSESPIGPATDSRRGAMTRVYRYQCKQCKKKKFATPIAARLHAEEQGHTIRDLPVPRPKHY